MGLAQLSKATRKNNCFIIGSVFTSFDAKSGAIILARCLTRRDRITMAKWRDVRGWLLSYIQEHGLLEGAVLPSDREVARACGCSLQPVIHAMQDLAAE